MTAALVSLGLGRERDADNARADKANARGVNGHVVWFQAGRIYTGSVAQNGSGPMNVDSDIGNMGSASGQAGLIAVLG